jgi:hypothetical protein
MSNGNVALQANFKTASGALLNVYGEDATAFEFNLKCFVALVPEIIAAERALQTGVAPASAVDTVVASLGGQVVSQTPAPQAPAPSGSSAPSCRHGIMQHVDPANKPWSGYFCPQPKEATDKCSPIFDKK